MAALSFCPAIDTQPCKHFLRGHCRLGPNRCRFLHPGAKTCTYFAQGRCTKGEDCPYLHVAPRSRTRFVPESNVEKVVTVVTKTLVKQTKAMAPAAETKKLALPRPPPPPTVVEVALCFDTTGSMYSYLDAVRANLDKLITSLVTKAEKHGAQLKLGVIAHGDYCDKNSAYVIKFLPLLDTRDKKALGRLHHFVTTVGATSGGDGPECYELALNKASKHMGWSSHSQRSLVIVGDATPHEVGYTCGGFTNTLNWRKELADLARKHVRIYSVQAGGGSTSSPAGSFWKTLAKDTKGKHLAVSEMGTLRALITAAVARQISDRAFQEVGEELKSKGALRGEIKYVYEEIRTVRVQRVEHVASGGGIGPTGGGRIAAAASGGRPAIAGGGKGGGGGGAHGHGGGHKGRKTASRG